MPPPAFDALLDRTLSTGGPERLTRILATPQGSPTDDYLPWDKVRYKNPPPGLTHEEWWLGLKFARRQMQRPLPLLDKTGRPFTFAVPDSVLAALEQLNRDTSGHIGVSEQVTTSANRDRYLVSSLMEEAITSSQLEGATTTRQVAKEMIRSGRPPRDHSERMILNNYRAMRLVGEFRNEPLTPELILEIHRVVTDGTLGDPAASGRFQRPDEERVAIYSSDEVLLHHPPAAAELPERMDRLCRFANGEIDIGYVPPILRALTIHFMIGHDHPFEDGNGRTARALFYWSMLHQGYWMTEFLAISPLLKAAPGQYARSYLYSEHDEGDLTYFHIHQLNTLRRAVDRLHNYLERKIREYQDAQLAISSAPGRSNHRQVAIIEHALKDPGAIFTVQSHRTSHNVSYETARSDLVGLEEQGLLVKQRTGKAFTWTPAGDLGPRLRP